MSARLWRVTDTVVGGVQYTHDVGDMLRGWLAAEDGIAEAIDDLDEALAQGKPTDEYEAFLGVLVEEVAP